MSRRYRCHSSGGTHSKITGHVVLHVSCVPIHEHRGQGRMRFTQSYINGCDAYDGVRYFASLVSILALVVAVAYSVVYRSRLFIRVFAPRVRVM